MNREDLKANLLHLRKFKEISQHELAQKAGLSRIGYRKIEAGLVNPHQKTLHRLAQALGVELNDLLKPARILQKVRFRADKKMTFRDQLLSEIVERLNVYDELESLLDDAHPPFQFEPARKAARVDDPGRPQLVAQAARKSVGLEDGHLIRDICGLLEDNGVRVITPSVASPGFFGLSITEIDSVPTVVVNTWERLSVERWIFTATHELGHLLLHLDAYDVGEEDENQEEEKEADEFASYFLMPEAVFWKEWRQTRGLSFIDRILKLKRIFRVSYQTVLFRVAHSTDEPAKVYRLFYTHHKRRTGKPLPKNVEPDGLVAEDFTGRWPMIPPKRSEEYQRLLHYDFYGDRLYRLAVDAVTEGKLLKERAAELLGLSNSELEDLTQSWQWEMKSTKPE